MDAGGGGVWGELPSGSAHSIVDRRLEVGLMLVVSADGYGDPEVVPSPGAR